MKVAVAVAALLVAAGVVAGARGPERALRPPPPPKVSTPADIAAMVQQLSDQDLRHLLEFAAAAEYGSAPDVHRDDWDMDFANEVTPPRLSPPPPAPPDNVFLFETSPIEYDDEAAEPDTAYTHSAAAIAEYSVEGLDALPLMSHRNSKLHSTNSYSVPHYTVVGGSGQYGARGRGGVSVAVFKSRGAAYTLHPDGSLSPETPHQQHHYHSAPY